MNAGAKNLISHRLGIYVYLKCSFFFFWEIVFSIRTKRNENSYCFSYHYIYIFFHWTVQFCKHVYKISPKWNEGYDNCNSMARKLTNGTLEVTLWKCYRIGLTVMEYLYKCLYVTDDKRIKGLSNLTYSQLSPLYPIPYPWYFNCCRHP